MGVLDGLWDFLYKSRTLQQFFSLYRKNVLVAWRNWRATILRLCASFLFLVLALVIDQALQQNTRGSQANSDVPTPKATALTSIPSCHSDLYIGKKACVELIYSPNNAVTQAIMASVVSHNPIPISAVAYATPAAADLFLFQNSDYVIGAVQFIFSDAALTLVPSVLLGFLLETNSTVKTFKNKYQNPNLFVQLPLQAAVQLAIARHQLLANGSTAVANSLAFDISLSTFPHPAIATTSTLAYVLGPFIFAACMFSFVMQMTTMVMEKEAGLKQALRTMGMTDCAYWLSWGAWEMTLAFISATLITLFGMLLHFRLFLVNSYGVLFFLFFLFQLAMSSIAMFLTTFMSRAQAAVYLGFVIFLLGWILQVVVIFGVPYTPQYYHSVHGAVTVIFSIFPWDLLMKGFQDLGAASVGTNPGIDWSQRFSYCHNIPNAALQPAYNPREVYKDFQCVMPLGLIYQVCVCLWVGFFVLAIYCDNIFKNEHGVHRGFFYFLNPSYWSPRPAAAAALLRRVLVPGKQQPPKEGELDEDVLAEEMTMRALLNHRTGIPGAMAEEVAKPNAVEVFGLQRMYPGTNGCCGGSVKCCSCCSCCSCKRTDAFWSIKGSWFAIEQNSLFCLLGPNGAGKTTTINCLTGVIPATHGEALVYGEAISNPGGLDRIRSAMGVCPQFDVLWGELNGREHLEIYGSVKGLPWRGLVAEGDTLLEKVKLTYAGQQRTSAYSGGMKRRLSVAIALLGDPKVVYLDEPTTGMDPISRRYVWDIIQEAKVGRAIVLTTHSMEEADILGDRIAIMARGRLRCLGSSIRLKQRFGAGFQVSLSVMSANLAEEQDVEARTMRADRVKAFVALHLQLQPVEESKAYIDYVVERGREADLISFLAALEAQKGDLGVTDVQLSLTSLEEVFLNIARKAEIEVAQSLGDAETKVDLDDGTVLMVPLGAETVQRPGTNDFFKIRWGQDDAGHLVVLSTTLLPPDAAQHQLARKSASAAALTPPKQQAMLAAAAAGAPASPPMVASKSLAAMGAGSSPSIYGAVGNGSGRRSGGSGGLAPSPAPQAPRPSEVESAKSVPGFVGKEDEKDMGYEST